MTKGIYIFSLILLVFISIIVPSVIAQGGCCLNPETVACDWVENVSECCGSQADCKETLFYPGGKDACAMLPPGKAELCQMGCCCREFQTQEGRFVEASQEPRATCTGNNTIWLESLKNCIKDACTSLFGLQHPMSEGPPDWWHEGDGPVCWMDDEGNHHCYNPNENGSDNNTVASNNDENNAGGEGITWSNNPGNNSNNGYNQGEIETTSIYQWNEEYENLVYDNWTPELPAGSKCQEYGGICRQGLLVPFGANPCLAHELEIKEAKCGLFSSCCKIGSTKIEDFFDSTSSYELVHLGKNTHSGKKGVSFTIPNRGLLWVNLQAKNHWLSNNQYARVLVNGKPVGEVKNGERTLLANVSSGDRVFAEANGYVCFLFLCMASASVDLAYGTLNEPTLGTNIVAQFIPGGFADVYAGEASPSPLKECQIDWGDGIVEEVPTKGFGTIRHLVHSYDVPREYAIIYRCTDQAGRTSQLYKYLHSNYECYTPFDCEGKASNKVCVGDWTCENGKCVWQCAFDEEDQPNNMPSNAAENAKKNAIRACIGYCNSDDPATQASFFAMNNELQPFQEELGLDGTDCLALLDDISQCSQGFKLEFNKMIDRVQK